VTTRALEPIPEPWAGPILELADAARAAAVPDGHDDALWVEAESRAPKMRTNYRGSRRTAFAGQYAAHLLRLRALDLLDQGTSDPWVVALAETGPVLNSWDWDERMYGALALRKTYKDLPAEHPERAAIRPTSYVAGWLTHAAGESLVPATGRLAQYALDHTPLTRDRLTVAWYAVHGARFLDDLTITRENPGRGRPALEDAERLALVRTAVRAIHTARLTSKTDLAQRAGITRPTLDAWLQAGSHV
jgi:hypothetical protein